MKRILTLFSFLILSVLSVAQPSVLQGRLEHDGMTLGGTAIAYTRTPTRQTALEIANATVDKAMSWSCWVKFSNIRNTTQRVFNVSSSDNSAIQYALNLVSQDNQTPGNNNRLRFSAFTNNSNVMEIQTTDIILKNRYYHIAVTYTGSEVNTGLEIYINGVKDATPSRFLVGTYTGGIDNANLRFKIGHEVDGSTMGGEVRDVAIWNRVLTDSEVTELYNQGVPKANASMSFAADVVSDWPLHTNKTSLTNASYSMTDVSSSGVAHAVNEFSFSAKDAPLSFRRATVGNTRYVGFGNLIRKDANTASWFGYSGTTHPGSADAYIVRIDFDLTTQTASAPVIVIDDPTYSMSGVTCGIDANGDIHVFAARYDIGGAAYVDARHYKSTDGGTTFDAGEVFSTTRPRYEFYGQMVPGFATGEYFVPLFEHTSATTWTISVFRTTDNWATHSKIQVYDGTDPKIGEASIWNVGNNTLLMLARQDASPFGIWQMTSTDGGATWSVPSLTNLTGSTAASNCEITQTANGKLAVFLMDRGDDYSYLSKDNLISTVLANPLAWNTPKVVLRSYTGDTLNFLGYQGAIKLDDGNILAVTSLEFSSSRADLYFGIGSPY